MRPISYPITAANKSSNCWDKWSSKWKKRCDISYYCA